ncbi:ATP-binding protein [Streptomyces griseosporeus]|uniref:ATP-binding protein n=1 Tax=Streptomyces griseosporeus TaxID=1910 RepID=UPI0036BD01E4
MVAEYPFVGRADVLFELRRALERAVAGRGGLVTLTGAAGAGKTRTAEEAAARADGLRTLWSWCPPETATTAFRPWARLLRTLVADDVRCGRLAAASPPLRALLTGATADVLRGADPESARLRLTGDVAELLATAAARHPLLLVLDDVHGADASSLRLLLETADATRGAPVLLLATARDDDAAWRDRAWARAQLLRRGRTLPLGPLPEADVAALVAAATGAAPAADAVRSLVRRTGGDAFFVTELLRAGGWDTVTAAAAQAPGAAHGAGAAPVVAGDAAPDARTSAAGASPVAVRAAVAARLAELTPRAAQLLAVASVLGTRFRLDVLAETAGVPLAEVRALLAESTGAGLTADPDAARGAFRHDLLREAVHATLSPGERAALHHTAATVLAGHARRGRDTGPAEVAHHLLRSGPGHEAEAAAYAHRAARQAEGLYAYEDAVRWYERAAECLAQTDAASVGVDGASGVGRGVEAVRGGEGFGEGRGARAVRTGGGVGAAGRRTEATGGDGAFGAGRGADAPAAEATTSSPPLSASSPPPSPAGTTAVTLVDVLTGLGSARFGAGDWQAARAALLRAARLARDARRPDQLARAALGLGTGPVGFEVDLEDREQLDLLTEARAALAADPAPSALRAAVTARLSLASALVEPEAQRVTWAEEAVCEARAAGDPATLGPALAALCDARPGPDHCHDRLARSAEIITVARALPDTVLELLGRRHRLLALLETGAFADADAEALAYETAVRPLRRPLYAWYVPLWRGARALMEGRYDDCAAAVEETEATGRAAGSANAALLAGTQRWCLYTETGDREALDRLLAGMPPLDRLPGLWPRVTLALLAAQSGRTDEAARRLSAVAPRLDGAARDSEWLPMLAQAAETVSHLGTHPAAGRLYALLAPYAGLWVVEGIGAAVRGPVERHLALLAAALDESAAYRRHHDRALSSAHAAGAVALADRIAGERPAATAVVAARTHTNPTPSRAGDLRSPAPRPSSPSPREPADDPPFFLREGTLWHLRYAGRDARVPDCKGLRDIAVLLARPGRPVPAVELAAPGGPRPAPAPDGLHPEGDTGEILDATARTAYRRRLRELEEEAEEADTAGDGPRSERIAVERDALVAQLSAAYGIGGRVRRSGSPVERARTAVTARIRAAVRRIAAVHPELGRHLDSAVRTGTLCVYQPENTPAWRV